MNTAMKAPYLLYVLSLLLLYVLVPLSALEIRAFVPVAGDSAAGEAAAGEASAAEGAAANSGTTAGESDGPALGTTGDGEGTSGVHPGESTGAGTGGANTGQEEGEEVDLGEVFEKVLDVIKEALPQNSDTPSSITAGPVPTSAVSDPKARACLDASDIYNACSAQTSDFDLYNDATYQASCLCYWTSSGLIGWQPSSYDNLMSSCLNYIKTQSGQVTAASEVKNQSGLCTSVGNVRQSAKDGSASLASYFATHTTTSARLPENTSKGSLQRVTGGLLLVIGISLSWTFLR